MQREIVSHFKMAPANQSISICVPIRRDSYEFSSVFLSHSCSNHAIALNDIIMVLKNFKNRIPINLYQNGVLKLY